LRRFRERLGYQITDAGVEPEFACDSPIAGAVRRQALDLGLDPNVCASRHTVRNELA